MILKKLVPLLILAWTIPVLAAQHALVVGINQYQHVNKLEGAVNDALLLWDVLRHLQVQLPDNRVLLDNQATRATFFKAWQDMLKHAKPGDTLILSFSGHGGQKPDGDPIDEKDHKDETLLFHDFNVYDSSKGYITDDEIYGLFQEADAYKIVFLVDACHSSGMVRSTERPSGKFRSGGFWNIKLAMPALLLPTRGDDRKPLPHVTLITAVEHELLKVPETVLDNKAHGALSWFFAQALNGKADSDKNGHLERHELEHFLREKVSNHMNNMQRPKLLPRADLQSVVKISRSKTSPSPYPSHIAIVIENGRMPGLNHIQLVNSWQTFDLLFKVEKNGTEVFNNTGDKVTHLPNNALSLWQRVIDKERLLKVLETQFNMRLKPINITLRDGNKTYKKGEIRHFSIEPTDKQGGLNALTLFNLAGDGELQFLYPLSEYRDPKIVKHFPYRLPPMKVAKPFGGDDLVAVLCKKPATGLHGLLNSYLKKNKRPLPTPEQLLRQLRNNTCQVGQYAFFSSE
ncbi:caspase family protein [Candidatus Parabeggiatoa sp. HSG14]|uniref:caspase family protein n=1 Tax=Candidatus Parabeggiatoa sp. HSG14 TaxID=3055593 RepID=UPI0025A889A8|nr:caspase family protein [Thiotrichales bacterium HSG14]